MTKQDSNSSRPQSHRRRLKLGRFSIPLPRSRSARLGLGLVLMLGGALWFLPIVGLWMLPAGVLVLSADSAHMRRLRRRAEVWWGKRNSREKRAG